MSDTELNWAEDASAKINGAPPLIRTMIRKMVEKAAREEGVTDITLDYVTKLQSKFMR